MWERNSTKKKSVSSTIVEEVTTYTGAINPNKVELIEDEPIKNKKRARDEHVPHTTSTKVAESTPMGPSDSSSNGSTGGTSSLRTLKTLHSK